MPVESNPYLAQYLEKAGLTIHHSPIPTDGHNRLNQLLAAGIAPAYDTAAGVFAEISAAYDVESIRQLHEIGTSASLLADTTNFLFRDQLLHFLRSEDANPPDPLTIFKQLVTPDLLRRVGLRFHSIFVTEVIGQGTVTKWDLSWNELVKKWYGTDMQLPSPIHGLRGLVTNNLLALEKEKEIEEWLITASALDMDEKQHIRDSRLGWLLELNAPKGTSDLEMEKMTSAYIRIRIDQLCDQEQPEQAAVFLRLLDAAEQVDACDQITWTYLKQNKQAAAIALLHQVRQVLKTATVLTHQVPLYAHLVPLHIYAADSDGLIESLRDIGHDGFTQVCHDLGVNPKQLAHLFMLGCFTQASVDFHQLAASDIVDVINRIYRQNTFLTEYGYERYRMYGTLVMLRILTLGEQGINYPPAEDYRMSRVITQELAIRFGQQGDEDNFIKWLAILKTIPNVDGQTIRYVYDVIKGASS